MIALTRTQISLMAAGLLLVGAGLGLGVAYHQEIRAWAAHPGSSASEQSDEHQDHAMSGMSMDEGDHGHDMSSMTAEEDPGERKILYWYDPMHPAYKSDKPGVAPDCGMELVPKYADEMKAMEDRPKGTVMLSPEKQQLIGIRTTHVERKRLERTIQTVGRLAADDTRIARVHVKVAGWVEKVNVDFVGKLVRKGEPLFSLYSPELLSTQQEYLIARRGERYLSDSPYAEAAEGAESILRAARARLQLWDITEDQIKKLEETGEAARTLTLHSPIDGFVTHRNLFERMYVTPDTELYEIADLSNIWVYVDIYEYEVPYVRVGQTATMKLSYYPGKTYTGRVSYVYPTLDPRTRTVKVRLEFPNPGFDLKPEMFADVKLQVDYGVQTLVPSEAVLDSGERHLVFLAKPGGFFEPREIQVGARLENQYIVLSGLEPGDTIVTSGNFLVDSESRLSTATEGMSHQH